MALRSLLCGMVLAAAAVAPAAAQMDSREGIALQNQILELRRDLQILQAQRGGGGGGGYVAPPPTRGGGGGGEIAAQLLDRVQSLEEEVRRLHGRLDEQANASRRAQDDLSKQMSDLSFRLQNSAPAASSGPAANLGSSLGAGPTPGTAAPTRRPPELAMQEGNAALARRDYAMAEAAAREVLAGGRGPRAGDAQFLLAQSLSGKHDWQGAAIAYDDAYNRSRSGVRAPEALLGVANSMLALNDRAAACASVEKLRTEFPSLRAEVRDGAAAIRGRAGCR